MSDQNFHEIQLSGKQLVFLFMCMVVLTVVVFLIGVSVGRGVRSAAPQTATAPSSVPAPADTTVPAEAPPPTQTTPNELSYAQALQGRDGEDPSKVTPPPPASENAPAADSSSKSAAGTSSRSEPAAPPKAAAPLPPAAKAAPLNGFFVQVEAFSTNDTAAKAVAKLRNKGYPAFVFSEPQTTPGPRYKVRVGPYSARSEADQMLKSLTKEGYKPLIRR